MARNARRRTSRVTRRAPARPTTVSASRELAPPATATIEIRLFDGARRPAKTDALLRLFNGRQERVFERTLTGPVIRIADLPVADNLDDRYVVSAASDGCIGTGFSPVVIHRGETTRVDLMLVPKKNRCDFSRASWTALSSANARLATLLAADAPSQTAAKLRYETLMTEAPRALAALFNIWTASASIFLSDGTPVDYFRAVDWTARPPAQDRVFCWADARLVDEVVQAARRGVFAPEPNPQVFHKGATRSYKQVQFGEANVQLTFHEHDTRTIDGIPCVIVECDIDYYKDLLAHGLLEVLPSRLTEPEQAYALRWMAGQQAGVPPFAPPYTIVASGSRAVEGATTASSRGIFATASRRAPGAARRKAAVAGRRRARKPRASAGTPRRTTR